MVNMPQLATGRVALPTFWGGGFDSPSPLARLSGRAARIDLVAATAHDQHAADDYALLAQLGIGWSREDVRWHCCEPRPGRYDFSHLEPIVDAACTRHITIIWSWMHYGCPAFVDPRDGSFPDRLAALGERHLDWLRHRGVADPIVCPINEISYYCWHVETLGNWHPFAGGTGRSLKASLIAAHQRCFELARAITPNVRILMIDPFYTAVGNVDDPDSLADAAFWRGAAWEAMDHLAAWSDLLGINFYPESQVECYRIPGASRFGRRLLPLHDPRCLSLRQALTLVHARYGPKPLVVAETSVRGQRRLPWLTDVTDAAITALATDVPLRGVCWYPILDVWDWRYLRQGRAPTQPRLSRSGLIRLDRTATDLRRRVSPTLMRAFRAQAARIDRREPSAALGAAEWAHSQPSAEGHGDR
jgi:hypothetical protein